MSDNELDAELLALAGDDSASEAEEVAPPEAPDNSSSPPAPAGLAGSSLQKPGTPPPRKGVAVRTVSKGSKSAAAKQRRRSSSDKEDGSISDAASQNSSGSAAMSESDSEADERDDGGEAGGRPMYPVEGKFRSERERNEIMAMPEIEREQILADRAQEAESQALNLQLRRLKQMREEAKVTEKKRKAGNAELEESPRKASRAKTKATQDLENYKRQREQRNEQRKRQDDLKPGARPSSSHEDGQSDADADGDTDVEWDDKAKKTPQVRDEPPAELRDFDRVRIGRSNFAQVCHYPGFEDAIKGCFCRVFIGKNKETGEPQYRMTQIKDIVHQKMYKMDAPNGIHKIFTDQHAILAHGKAEKDWPFLAVSDGKFTESEFHRYRSRLSEDGLRLPTKTFLSTKLNGIHALLNRTWTEAEISEKLRKSGIAQQKFASLERERLAAERAEAIKEGDEAHIARLDGQIAELDGPKVAFAEKSANGSSKLTPTKASTQQDRLAALNRANRKANAEAVRKAQIEERRRQVKLEAAIARGEATADPFARVKTKAKYHHDMKENKGSSSLQVPGSKLGDDLFGETSDRSRAGTPATDGRNGVSASPSRTSTPVPGQKVERKSGLGKKRNDDDVLAELDLGIDIDI